MAQSGTRKRTRSGMDTPADTLAEAWRLALPVEEGGEGVTSKTEIARRLNVARGTVYRWFSKRSDQLEAAYQARLEAQSLPPPAPPDTPPRRGRPPLIEDDRVRADVLEGVALGQSYERACMRAGINRRTYREWTRRAEAGDEPYADFFDELLAAECEGEFKRLQRIEAGDPGWQGAAFIQERRNRREWGKSEAPGVQDEEALRGLDNMLRQLNASLAGDAEAAS